MPLDLAVPPKAAVENGFGSLRGTVAFVGEPPKPTLLNRSADPYCNKTDANDESLIVNSNRTVRGVLVHLNNAPPQDPPSSPTLLSQEQCTYLPHVLGIVAGQTLRVHTVDAVLHNVHSYKGTSTLFNQVQIPNTPDIEKKFSEAGALLKFKCDVHNWMTAYVWVQNNSYFAITGDSGAFEMRNVPAGTWEIETWHERLPPQKIKIVVERDKLTELELKLRPY